MARPTGLENSTASEPSPPPAPRPSTNLYQEHWDHFAKMHAREGDRWPGDEWGTPETWNRLFDNVFVPSGVSHWKSAVEIGAGSGKYTLKVLNSSHAHVLAADVSSVYQDHFCARLKEAQLFDRVTPLLLNNDSSTLRKAIEAKGWKGSLDAFYSIDAMVHVDLQHLMVYFITAAVCLRPGGKLIMTLANCCSEKGFEKLVNDTKVVFSRVGKHTGKFEWMSPDQVTCIVTRLGFQIDKLATGGRDIALAATLHTPPKDPKVLDAVC
jgi:SAM-dependent methyltransferase